MRFLNPRWWAQQRRPSYEALRRFYRGQQDPQAQRKLAQCCHYLRMFEDWEKGLAAAGATVPRQVEQALRRDGQTDSDPGEDYELVRRYLEAQ